MSEPSTRAGGDAFERLTALLDLHGARYRVIHHPPEGQTERASALRGHDPRAAAKCLVMMVKQGKKTTRFVLAVVPGDRKVDTRALARLFNATYVGFASATDAERISGCLVGTVLPFSFDEQLRVVVDPAVFETAEMFFNAGRLDVSIALETADYRRIANAAVEAISLPSSAAG